MLTEKGTEAFEFILTHYKAGEEFKSKDNCLLGILWRK